MSLLVTPSPSASTVVLPNRRQAIFIFAALAMTAVATKIARPTRLMAAEGKKVDLEALIPNAFGGWQIDTSVVPLQPAPDLVAKIEFIYDATLARTYVNARGQRVMLSIAYGGDQTGRLRVHRPESCYPAQGFAVKKLREEVVAYGASRVPLNRLDARLGGRSEPITYWIRVGSETVTGNIGQRFAQLKYGINGDIPDGLIFRVSSIDPAPESAFKVHDAFISSLLAGMDAASVERLVGKRLNPV